MSLLSVCFLDGRGTLACGPGSPFAISGPEVTFLIITEHRHRTECSIPLMFTAPDIDIDCDIDCDIDIDIDGGSVIRFSNSIYKRAIEFF